MAVEEMRSKGPVTVPADLVLTLREMEERLKQISEDRSAPRFDTKFVSDIAIALAVFAFTVALFVARVPVIGDPWALLLGPTWGLILALKHRPPR